MKVDRDFRDGGPILPGSALGILGSGQLGRMTAIAARHMGYRVVSLGPSASDPAAGVSDTFIAARLDDLDAAERLGQAADVVTLEFENVSAKVVGRLEAMRPVRPSASVLALAQDRIREKESLERLGVPVAPFAPVRSLEELHQAIDRIGLPCLLKTARGGYDGKGQIRIESAREADGAFARLGNGQVPLVAEALVPFTRELSVIVSRGRDGEMASFPVCENEHVQGILHRTIAPARVPPTVREAAGALAERIASSLGVVGTLAVEMFFVAPDQLLVNELAPRPHNSGHYTLDACAASQFEQHIRAVCGLPLASTRQWAPAVMLNLLGEHMPALAEQCTRLLAEGGVKLHLYGKVEARPGRKMGHLTVLGDSMDEALEIASRAWSLIGAGV